MVSVAARHARRGGAGAVGTTAQHAGRTFVTMTREMWNILRSCSKSLSIVSQVEPACSFLSVLMYRFLKRHRAADPISSPEEFAAAPSLPAASGKSAKFGMERSEGGC